VAEPYAVAKCLEPKEANDFSGIFIDIGGGTTDIALVDNGGLVGTKMFALGGRTFTKRVAEIMNEKFSEAEKIKINYSAENLPKEDIKIISHGLINDAQVWLSGVELTLEEFSSVDILPSKIMLCGGGVNLPEIQEILKSPDWYKDLPFAKKPTIHFINPKDVVNIEDETGDLIHVSDVTPMALANLALDIAGPIDVIDHVIKQVTADLRK